MSECTKEYSRKRCLGEEIKEYVVAARKREIVRERERETRREDDCGRNDRKKNMFKQRLLNVYNDLWLHLSYCLVEFNGVINGPYVSRKRHLS